MKKRQQYRLFNKVTTRFIQKAQDFSNELEKEEIDMNKVEHTYRVTRSEYSNLVSQYNSLAS